MNVASSARVYFRLSTKRLDRHAAHVANYFETHRLEFKHLADVFTKMLELATTVRAA
jgi:hypothetical protein